MTQVRGTGEKRHPGSGGPQPGSSGPEASRAMGLQVKESQGRQLLTDLLPLCLGWQRDAVVVVRGNTCVHTHTIIPQQKGPSRVRF